jgi:5S rRNA maturation endonuclease (ribonuclease M5)
MNAYERLIDALRSAGKRVDDHGARAAAQCPAHDDQQPSLSVTRIDESVLLYCHVGCQTDDVLGVLGLSKRDLYDDRNGVTYEYPDGRRVHRTAAKRFRQSGNTKGRSLYRADRIGDAATVYVVEGEKDVHAIEAVGAIAVCPAMGAGKADRFDWTPLRGKHAIIVADKDEPGRQHAAQVASQLRGVTVSVDVVQAAVGKDAADHIAAGKTLDRLVDIELPDDNMPKVWKATELKPARQPEWLGKKWIPRAATSILVGDEGIGKSLFWTLVVAAITTGKSLPECGIPPRDPALVVIVVTEDDWQTTVLPRLIVAGADLNMIRVICTEDDCSGAPLFPRDIHLIHEMDTRPALLVVDAWLDTVPAALVVRDPQGARQALHPWRELATKTGAAVMLLTHTNRVATDNVRDRYGATSELRKKARMTLYAQQDDEGRLVIGPEKANSVATADAAVFVIEAVQHFTPTTDDDGTVGRLKFVATSDRTAREHLTDAYEAEHGEDRQDRAEAAEWLSAYLEVEGPEANSAEVKARAKKAGISERTLQRARKELGVIWGRTGFGRDSITTWSLPSQATTANKCGHTEVREDDDERAGDEEEKSELVDRGTTCTSGITACQTNVPSHATSEVGTSVAQLFDQPVSPVVPVVPPTPASQPRGAPTPNTPGMTEQVARALAKARSGTRKPDNATKGLDAADWPLCILCGQAMLAGQTEMHLNCRRVVDAGRPPDEKDDQIAGWTA